MKLERICPKCSLIVVYKSIESLKRAILKNSICRNCFTGEGNPFFGKTHSKESRNKMSTNRKGQNNSPKTQFGGINCFHSNKKPIYQCWVEKYGKEEADKRKLQEKIRKSIASSGIKNPMYGKLAPTGSGNGWSGWYKGFYFRSLYELSYLIFLFKNNIHFTNAERKNLTVKYLNYKGENRTYRADFLVDLKYLIECKPNRLHNTPNNLLKKEAAEKFCKENGLIYKMIQPKKINNDKIKELYLNNEIVFIERYDKKFKEKYLC